MSRSRLLAAACALVLGVAANGCDSTSPSATITGTWDFVSYTDAGVVGAATGTAVFQANGSFSIVGTITYPGEPTDSINVSGSYTVSGNAVTLTFGTDSSTWQMSVSASDLTLTFGTQVIHLRRRS